jgi:hypothetical protein
VSTHTPLTVIIVIYTLRASHRRYREYPRTLPRKVLLATRTPGHSGVISTLRNIAEIFLKYVTVIYNMRSSL